MIWVETVWCVLLINGGSEESIWYHPKLVRIDSDDDDDLSSWGLRREMCKLECNLKWSK